MCILTPENNELLLNRRDFYLTFGFIIIKINSVCLNDYFKILSNEQT